MIFVHTEDLPDGCANGSQCGDFFKDSAFCSDRNFYYEFCTTGLGHSMAIYMELFTSPYAVYALEIAG